MRVIGGIADGQLIVSDKETITVQVDHGASMHHDKRCKKYRRIKHAIGATSFEAWVPDEMPHKDVTMMVSERIAKVWGMYLSGDENRERRAA